MYELVKQIRSILDSLARAEKADNDTKEVVYDRELARIREFDRANIIEVVKKAVGNNPRRQRYAPFVFSELHDVPGIENTFQALLESADDTGRADIIQTIGIRKMRSLIGVLNEHFELETDDFCRRCLLHTLGRLADESSLPIFRYLMKKTDRRDEWPILVAARSFGTNDFKSYLTETFYNESTKTTSKVMAAWGLAKLGEMDAYNYLITMLDDPEIQTQNSYDPGHSIRAAQAVSDINGWDFEWDKSSVALVKDRLSSQNQPETL